MRQLHPVSFNERFVAGGEYVCYDGDTPTGDVERWTLHEPGAGSRTIRADYDGQAGSGINWLFEGLALGLGGAVRIERFDLLLLGAEQKTEAKLMFGAQGVDVSRRVDGAARQMFRISDVSNLWVAAPSLVARYWFLRNLPLPRGEVTVFEADIDFAVGILRGGQLKTVQIEPLDLPAPVPSEWTAGARGFRFDGTRDRGETCWLNAHWIPVYYQDAAGRNARLAEYTHRPEQSP